MRHVNNTPMWWRAGSSARAHKARCQALPPPSEAELAQMVEEFHRRGGAVTEVPPAYVASTLAARDAASPAAP